MLHMYSTTFKTINLKLTSPKKKKKTDFALLILVIFRTKHNR